MADTDKILDLDYEEREFVDMLDFLKKRKADSTPYISQPDDGYTYVFASEADKIQFDTFWENNKDAAMSIYKYRWKNGVEKYMVVDVKSDFQNDILLGSTDNTIRFEYYSTDGGVKDYESVTVNYTITTAKGIVRNVQEQYGAGRTATFVVDSYLEEGVTTVDILVTGDQSKKTASARVTFNASVIDIDSDFAVSTTYGINGTIDFKVRAIGNVEKIVEFYIDGVERVSEAMKVSADDSNIFLNVSLHGVPVAGKHFLQMRTRAVINKQTCYSKKLYYEFVVKGEYADYVTIGTAVKDPTILGNPSLLTIYCEQYIKMNIPYGYYHYNEGRNHEIKWELEPVNAGEYVSLGTTMLDSSTLVEGQDLILTFLPTAIGSYKLKAIVDGEEKSVYDIVVDVNSSGLAEAMNGLTCRLLALGRSNSEPENERNQWEYKTIKTSFTDVPFNDGCGWVKNALKLFGGKAVVNTKPFNGMSSPQSGCTIEIDFETFNVVKEDTPLLVIGDNTREYIKITGTSALFTSFNGTQLKDKFTANKRTKLAFIVHPKSATSTNYPMLMEIINNGVSSRCCPYSSSDSYYNTNNIVIGGSSDAGIMIYSIRTYNTDLSTKQELDNTIVDSDDIAQLVADNSIYIGGKIDIDLIKNKIACLSITGHGGSDTFSYMCNQSGVKTLIHADVEWTNPLAPNTNWRCLDMRLRTHGQSTKDFPLKSIKGWLKQDSSDQLHNTRFYFPASSETPMADPRWSMKQGAMPLTKFVWQCYYIDSSNCKSPALLAMINDCMTAAGIITEPMKYVRDNYKKDMKDRYPDKDYSFPYSLRLAPDSIPCIVISRDDESSDWVFGGIYVLMDDKKSDYLYGERSIYSAPNDPFCFYSKKSQWGGGVPLWDNKNVIRIEFVDNSHPISTFRDISSWMDEPKADWNGKDEDENSTSLGEGGDGAGAVASQDRKIEYDFENAFELIYPDYDDVVDAVTGDKTKYFARIDKVYEFFKFVNDCYLIDNGGSGAKAELQAHAAEHMDLEHWAAYYVIAMENGTFDSLVRNMQLITFDGVKWLPLWWDIDVQYGTINTGPLRWDNPPVDRDTKTILGDKIEYAFRGEDSFLWDALEDWGTFISLCSSVLTKISHGGYNLEGLISKQNYYVDTYPKAMYNESEDFKYKKIYLKDPANNRMYLEYLLGDGTTFRRWWMTKSFNFWESRFAAGSFLSNYIDFRCDEGSSGTLYVTYGEDTYCSWGKGDILQPISGSATSIKAEAGKPIPFGTGIGFTNSDWIRIYNPQSIQRLDLSERAAYIANANLGAFTNAVTGSMLTEFLLGVSEEALLGGTRNGLGNEQIGGLANLPNLIMFQMQGYINLPSLDISGSGLLEELYLKGSGFSNLILAKSLTLKKAELPNTLVSLDMDGVKFTNYDANSDDYSLQFFDPQTLSKTLFPVRMTHASFVHMGSDNIVRMLIAEWIQYNIQQNTLDRLTIKLTDIAWDNSTFEEVERLGLIPKDKQNRVYTGTIMLNETLSTYQINRLKDLFNDADSGISIFELGSSFKVDCKSGMSISVSTDILSGNDDGTPYREKVEAVVFPITQNETIVRYSIDNAEIIDIDGEMVYSIKNVLLFSESGILQVEESNYSDFTFTLRVSEERSGNTGTVNIKVRRRTYPSMVDIDGNMSIASVGNYEFKPFFGDETFSGTYTVRWQLNELPCVTVKSGLDDKVLKIAVSNPGEDTFVLNVNMRVFFGNGAEQEVESVCIIHVPINIITRVTNAGVLELMRAAGIAKDPDRMTDTEAWLVRNEASANYKAMPFGSFRINPHNKNISHFEEIKWFYYLNSLDFRSVFNLGNNTFRKASGSFYKNVTDYDLTDITELTSVDYRGTSVSPIVNGLQKLTTLKVGAPEKANSVRSLTSYLIQDANRVTDIDYKHKGACGTLVDIINRKARASMKKNSLLGVTWFFDGNAIVLSGAEDNGSFHNCRIEILAGEDYVESIDFVNFRVTLSDSFVLGTSILKLRLIAMDADDNSTLWNDIDIKTETPILTSRFMKHIVEDYNLDENRVKNLLAQYPVIEKCLKEEAYLDMDGNGYFLLDYYHKPNTEVETELMITRVIANKVIFGSADSTATTAGTPQLVFANQGNGILYYRVGGVQPQNLRFMQILNESFRLKLNTTTITVNGIDFPTGATTNGTATRQFGIWGGYNRNATLVTPGGLTGRLYYFIIKEGTTTKHFYVPVANNTMVDLVDGSTITRSGSGTLTLTTI